MSNQIHVSQATDIPKEAHIAVLEFSSITIPGDERSRQCPGHGYPEHSVTNINYIVMKDEAALADWIERNTRYGASPRFEVIRAQRVQIEKKVTVTLK